MVDLYQNGLQTKTSLEVFKNIDESIGNLLDVIA